jgi:hypothetical protein
MMNGSSEPVITIRHVKGDKHLKAPIRRELVQLLRLHIGGRRAGPLFVSPQQGSRPTSHVLTRQRARLFVGGRPDWSALATAFGRFGCLPIGQVERRWSQADRHVSNDPSCCSKSSARFSSSAAYLCNRSTTLSSLKL